MTKFIRTELTRDMKSFVESVGQSLLDQHASGQEFKEAAREISHRFLPTTSPQSAYKNMQKAILTYLIEHGYTSNLVLNAGYVDDHGIEITDPDAKLPRELSSRIYGCRIDVKESNDIDEVLEMLYDQEFLSISAYKLRDHGILYPNKFTFFAHPRKDCSEWAKDIVADYPGYFVGKTFNIVWSQYYDIEVQSESSSKIVSFHKLRQSKGVEI